MARVAASLTGQILHVSNNRPGTPGLLGMSHAHYSPHSLRERMTCEVEMPIISVFFGIVIRMYHDEHPPPHFHAAYQGFEAFVGIVDGEIIHGSLPKKAARIVRQWTLDHQDELMANWERGEALQPMEMVPGADVDD